jgi:hypothetical protein
MFYFFREAKSKASVMIIRVVTSVLSPILYKVDKNP